MTQHALITGGAGFIGSHLVDRLLEDGWSVTVVDDLSTGSIKNIAHLEQNARFHFIQDDVRSPGLMDELCRDCDLVVHLAATVGVKHILQRPLHTIENNFMGAQAVLSAADRCGVKVLLTSTASVYGLNTELPYGEHDTCRMGPVTKSRWGYATSKLLNELMALAYHKERGLPVVVIRPFNTIGTRQTEAYGHVVPAFVKQAMRDEPLTIYGDGRQRRCFCDVRDVVRAYLLLAESDAAVGRVFNVGNDHEVTILELSRQVLGLVDIGLGRNGDRPYEERITFIPYDVAYPDGFVEMYRRIPDISRIRSTLGWEAEIPLETTIQEIFNSLQNAARKTVRVKERAL